MRWIATLFVALFIFVVGCGQSFHYTRVAPYTGHHNTINVFVDRNFTAQDDIQIDNALATWNYSFNGQLEYKVVDDKFDMEPSIIRDVDVNGGLIILKVDSKTSEFIPDANGEQTLAWCNDIGGHYIFVVKNRISTEDIYSIMLHEIGHSLKLPHMNSGLMMPHFVKADYMCIDKEAAYLVAEANGLKKEKMNYCLPN